MPTIEHGGKAVLTNSWTPSVNIIIDYCPMSPIAESDGFENSRGRWRENLMADVAKWWVGARVPATARLGDTLARSASSW